MTTEHPLIVLILVAFATFSLVDAQAVSLSLLDYRAGATSVTVTGRLTATTYVPPFSVLTITISGTFPSGNFNSPADVVTSSNGDSGRLLRYEHWSIEAGSSVRNSNNDNYRSNFMSYAPYQTNSRTGSGWSNRWHFFANVEDWFVRRYSTAICPTATGTYGFKIDYVDDMFELFIAPDDQVNFAVDATSVTGSGTGSMHLTAGVRYAMIGFFFEKGGGEAFVIHWKPPGSSSYAEIDSNVYCNARASMNGGVLKVYLSWPLFQNEIITFNVNALPNPLNPQTALSNVASGFYIRDIPLVNSRRNLPEVTSTSASGTYPSIQNPILSPVTFNLCGGDPSLALSVNLLPRISLPLGSRLLFKPFSSFSALPPSISWSLPSGVGSTVIFGLPVTSGLVGYYSADSWTSTKWNDLSPNGNHATEVKADGISVVPATNHTPAYVRGTTSDWVKFPPAILPSGNYTLFVVARYDGPIRGRIVQGVTDDWASGHMHGKSGVSWHSPAAGCGWVSEQVDCCGDQWTMSVDAQSSTAASVVFRVNGVDQKKASGDCGFRPRIGVNTGSELSDWAIQHIIVYNRVLSLTEIQNVEAFLSAPTSVTVMPTSSSTSFAANSAVQFQLGTFNNSAMVQAITSASIAVGGPTALSILASGTGTFHFGANRPNITLSSTSIGDTNVTMTVVITPESIIVPLNGKIIVFLAGAGITLSETSSLAFSSPSDAAGTFSMSSLPFDAAGTVSMSSHVVLIVSLTAGTFNAGSPIVFTITKVTNPSSPQSVLSNIAAVVTTSDMIPICSSTAGTFPAINQQRKRWAFMCGSAANNWACQ